jgi:hypothetical protein
MCHGTSAIGYAMMIGRMSDNKTMVMMFVVAGGLSRDNGRKYC